MIVIDGQGVTVTVMVLVVCVTLVLRLSSAGGVGCSAQPVWSERQPRRSGTKAARARWAADRQASRDQAKPRPSRTTPPLSDGRPSPTVYHHHYHHHLPLISTSYSPILRSG